jgi:hypothetical protein
MYGGDDPASQRVLDRFAVVLREPEGASENPLSRGCAQAYNDLGLYGLDLRLEPRPTRFDFRGTGLLMNAPLAALFELEMFDDVGDIDISSRNAGLFESAVQKLSGGPNEGVALQIFFIPRLLADKE